MRTVAQARSWPFPARTPDRRRITAHAWEPLVATARLEPNSADARELINKVGDVLESMQVTLDGRLVTEAEPRAAEILDPLRRHGIPGCLALMKYLADMDALSMEQLLGPAWEVAERQLGFPGSSPHSYRVRSLSELAQSLEIFLPAMVHAAAAAEEKLSPGRPARKCDESIDIVIELRAIWAEHAEGDRQDFFAFVESAFALAEAVPPSQDVVKTAWARVPDADQLDARALAAVRLDSRRRRSQLAKKCRERGQVRMMVSSSVQNGRTAARALGCDDPGPAAQWRADIAERARSRRVAAHDDAGHESPDASTAKGIVPE